MKKKNEGMKIKSTKIENAFWLSSFIAIFIPCCYTKPIFLATVTAIDHDERLLRKLGNFFCVLWNELSDLSDNNRESYRRKVLRYQDLGALSVYGVAVVITYILVTFTTMGYMDNMMDSNTFLSYFLFILIQGKSIFLNFCFNQPFVQVQSF